MRTLVLIVLMAMAVPGPAQDPPTVPEASQWKRTSTTADVRRFLTALKKLKVANRLTVTTFGTSLQGRPLTLVKASMSGNGKKLRALIIANIHGGEVEGKEVVQILCREIAQGGHEEILRHCDVWFVPVFNADGNDEINIGNRTNQNGPDGGVGRRTNAQGLDLNRDFVKAESPEVRGLLGLFRNHDPHLFMDLHTTNGSNHGYHLTYAPSLATGQDPVLDAFMHEEFMPAVRARSLKNDQVRVFDYGNFPRSRDGQKYDGGWWAFSAHPRLGWNYGGLRNRLSILSEAYAYKPFDDRIRSTKSFVLSSLRTLVERRKTVAAICDAADLRVSESDVVTFGHDIEPVPPEKRTVLIGKLERVKWSDRRGSKLVVSDDYTKREVPVSVRFRARQTVKLPVAWAIVSPSDDILRTLLLHGIEVRRVVEAIEVEAEAFEIKSMSRLRARFQGHRLVTAKGDYVAGKHTLAEGTLLVRARQRLGRLAAWLLEGASEDGLATWNFFDAQLKRAEDANGSVGYPVLRVMSTDGIRARRVRLDPAMSQVAGAMAPAPETLKSSVRVKIDCESPGRRIATNAYETAFRWEDRKIFWTVGGKTAAAAEQLAELLGAADGQVPLVIAPGPHITHEEVLQVAKAGRKAGFKIIYLERAPE